MTEKLETMQGYCLKCRAKKNIANAKKSEFKNGTPIMLGTCEDCGNKLFRILKKTKAAE